MPPVAGRKGYDAEHLHQYCDCYRMQPVIPLRTVKRKPKVGLPKLLNCSKYRQRNIIDVDVRLAEGEPQDRYSLRQAGEKFFRNGHASLHTAVPTAVLFVQNLALPVAAS